MMDNMGSTGNGANVAQWASGGSPNQQWVVTYNSGGYYTLACVTGGLLLDTGGNTANGSTVQQWGNGGSPNQHWTFQATDSGYYKIVSVACGQCVDTGGQTANGSALQLWGNGGSPNQQWSFTHVGSIANGTYKLIARHSGKALGCERQRDGQRHPDHSMDLRRRRQSKMDCDRHRQRLLQDHREFRAAGAGH